MRRLSIIAVLFMALSILMACGARSIDHETKTEIMSEDYGDAIILAQNEFANTFSEYDGIEITETSTMVRTNDSSKLIVQFSYSSNNGNGVYGYEISRDDHGSYEIIRRGEDVTIDNLVKECAGNELQIY